MNGLIVEPQRGPQGFTYKRNVVGAFRRGSGNNGYGVGAIKFIKAFCSVTRPEGLERDGATPRAGWVAISSRVVSQTEACESCEHKWRQSFFQFVSPLRNELAKQSYDHSTV